MVHRIAGDTSASDASPRIVIFTDLDGTLLDGETYSYDPAIPALDYLHIKDIPLIFCTSKTRVEVEALRRRMQCRHPFIVENGGAVYVPEGYFTLDFHAPARRAGFQVFEFGDSQSALVEILAAASRESRCRVRAFSSMTVDEVAARCGLSAEQALLAKQREYDEPFEILDLERQQDLCRQIERHNRRWTRGGRFYHIFGANDKADCVRLLTGFYERAFGGPVVTVGLGDGPNDVTFLNAVNVPVVIHSPWSDTVQAAVPGALATDAAGPEGWNTLVFEILGRLSAPKTEIGDGAQT